MIAVAAKDKKPAPERPEKAAPKAREGAGAAPKAAAKKPPQKAAAEQAQELLQQREAEIQKLSDQLLRAQADSQNVRRSADKDLQQMRLYANEAVVASLLPGLDNLEQALQSFAAAAAGVEGEGERQTDAVKALAEGVEATLKSLEAALQKAGAVPIEAMGQKFDPSCHLATGVQEGPSKDGSQMVLQVLQRGWMLADRVLRPAMVIISAPAGAKAASGDSSGGDSSSTGT